MKNFRFSDVLLLLLVGACFDKAFGEGYLTSYPISGPMSLLVDCKNIGMGTKSCDRKKEYPVATINVFSYYPSPYVVAFLEIDKNFYHLPVPFYIKVGDTTTLLTEGNEFQGVELAPLNQNVEVKILADGGSSRLPHMVIADIKGIQLKVDASRTTIKVEERLNAIKQLAEPWWLNYSKALVLHAAYIGDQSKSVCNINSLLEDLASAFEIHGRPFADKIAQAGHVSAMNILINAVKTAKNIHAIDLGDKDEWQYLIDNETQIENQCSGETKIPPPSKESCKGFGLCESNASDFLEARQHLKDLNSEAGGIFDFSQKMRLAINQNPDWFIVLGGIE